MKTVHMFMKKGVVCSHFARKKRGPDTIYVDWFFAYHRILYSVSRILTDQFENVTGYDTYDGDKIPFYGGKWQDYFIEERLYSGKTILKWKHKTQMVGVNRRGCW